MNAKRRTQQLGCHKLKITKPDIKEEKSNALRSTEGTGVLQQRSLRARTLGKLLHLPQHLSSPEWEADWVALLLFCLLTQLEFLLRQESFSVLYSWDWKRKNDFGMSAREKSEINTTVLASWKARREGKQDQYELAQGRQTFLIYCELQQREHARVGHISLSDACSLPMKYSPNFCTLKNNLCLLKKMTDQESFWIGTLSHMWAQMHSASRLRPNCVSQTALGWAVYWFNQVMPRDAGQITSPL